MCVSRTTGSGFGGPFERIPEASAVPSSVVARVGRTSGPKPGLSPPSETNGGTSEEQKDERNKGHPKCRCGVGIKARVAQFPNFMLDEGEQGDIDSERDEGNGGGEEGCEGRKQGDRNMGGE